MRRGIQQPTVRIQQTTAKLVNDVNRLSQEETNGNELVGENVIDGQKMILEDQENRLPLNEAGSFASVSENAEVTNTSDSLSKSKSDPTYQIDIATYQQQLDNKQAENTQLSATCNELREKLAFSNKETENSSMQITTLNEQLKSLHIELSDLRHQKEKDQKELQTTIRTLTNDTVKLTEKNEELKEEVERLEIVRIRQLNSNGSDIQMAKIEMAELREHATTLQEENAQIQIELEKAQAERKRVEEQSNEAKKNDEIKMHEMEQSRIDETNQLRAQLESVMKELQNLRDDQCRQKNAETAELEERVEQLGNFNRELQCKVESLECLGKEWQLQQQSFESQISTLTSQVEMYNLLEKKCKEKEEEWLAQNASKIQEIEHLMTTLKAQKEKETEAFAEKDKLESRISELINDKVNLQNKIEQMQDELKQMNTCNQAHEEHAAEYVSREKLWQSKEMALQNEKDTLQKELETRIENLQLTLNKTSTDASNTRLENEQIIEQTRSLSDRNNELQSQLEKNLLLEQEYRQKQDILHQQIEQLKIQLKGLETSLEEKTMNEQKLVELREKETIGFQSQIEESQKQADELQQVKQALNATVEKHDALKKQWKEKEDEWIEQARKHKNEIDLMSGELNELRTKERSHCFQQENTATALLQIKERNTDLQQQVENQKNEINALCTQLSQLQEKEQDYGNQQEEVKSKLLQFKQEHAQLLQQNAELQQVIKEKDENLSTQNASIQNELEKLQTDKSEYESKCQQLSQQVVQLEDKIKELVVQIEQHCLQESCWKEKEQEWSQKINEITNQMATELELRDKEKNILVLSLTEEKNGWNEMKAKYDALTIEKEERQSFFDQQMEIVKKECESIKDCSANEKTQLVNQIQTLETTTKELQVKIETISNEFETISKELETKNTLCTTLSDQYSFCNKNMETLSLALEEKTQALVDSSNKCDALLNEKNQNQALSQQIKLLQEELETSRKETECVKSKREQLENDMESLKKEKEEYCQWQIMANAQEEEINIQNEQLEKKTKACAAMSLQLCTLQTELLTLKEEMIALEQMKKQIELKQLTNDGTTPAMLASTYSSSCKNCDVLSAEMKEVKIELNLTKVKVTMFDQIKRERDDNYFDVLMLTKKMQTLKDQLKMMQLKMDISKQKWEEELEALKKQLIIPVPPTVNVECFNVPKSSDSHPVFDNPTEMSAVEENGSNIQSSSKKRSRTMFEETNNEACLQGNCENCELHPDSKRRKVSN